jgi:O-antigen/teichoic acid export membrane protein
LKSLGLHTLSQNIGSTVGRQVGATIIGLISQILIARFYGPAGNGIIAIALLLPTTLATFLNLGITPANVYFVASSQVSLRKAWYTTVRLGGLICLAGTAIGIAVVQLRPQWFVGVPPLALWLAMATFPPSLFAGLIHGLFQAKQNFKVFNRLGILQPIIQLLLVSCLVLFRVRDPSWVIASQLVSSIILLLIGLRLLQDQLARRPDNFPDTYKWQALSYGYKAHLANIIQFLNYKIDILIVNLVLGPAATGFYVVAVNVAERLWILSQATSAVILPRLSELSGDQEKRKELTSLLARWIFLVSVVVALISAVIIPIILPIIFGQRYSTSVIPLLALLPGVSLLTCTRVLASDLAARGKPEFNMLLALATLIVNVAGNIFLIPRLGLTGASLSTTLSYSVQLGMMLWIHHRFTGAHPLMNILVQRSDFARLRLLKPSTF